jgi:hypothetical protein
VVVLPHPHLLLLLPLRRQADEVTNSWIYYATSFLKGCLPGVSQAICCPSAQRTMGPDH